MSIRSVVLVTLLSSLAGDAAAQTAPGTTSDLPPVLLRDSLLLPPVESTGTGLAPEVRVRVSVDEKGRVDEVEVLSIRPSSDYDEFFARDVVRELEQWRYAPAIVDGRPAATRLEWTVQFRTSGVGAAADGLVPPILSLMDDADARHARVMGLPFEQQKELLLRFSAIAERHLERARRQEFAADRFTVVTDAKTKGAAEIVARNLDAALVFIHRVLHPHIEPQPSRLKVLVYLYASRGAFETMRGELAPLVGGGTDTATYFPPGLIVYHLEVPDNDALLSLLLHEATHAYSDHFLRRPGVFLPRWLEEGFAEYMGNSQVKKGELVPGRTLKRRFVLNHFTSGATMRNTVAGWDLQRVQDALRKGGALRLGEVAAADRDVFYGEQSGLYYGMSWLFVHFLRHGQPGWADEAFPLLVLYMAEGYPAKEALEAAYGTTLAELEAPFLEYARTF